MTDKRLIPTRAARVLISNLQIERIFHPPPSRRAAVINGFGKLPPSIVIGSLRVVTLPAHRGIRVTAKYARGFGGVFSGVTTKSYTSWSVHYFQLPIP